MAQTIGSLDLNAFSDLYSDSTQYFWFESNSSATYGAGAHVTLVPDTTFISNPTGQNILMNTDGFSVRNGLLPMMTLDNDSLDFNVVDTTAGTYITTASFSSTGTQIGQSDGSQSYLYLDYHSMQMVDKEGDTYFYVSDLRDESGELEVTDTFTSDGVETYYRFTYKASSTDYTVTMTGTQRIYTKSTTQIIFNVAPDEGATITVTYMTTSQRAKAYTVGTRRSGERLGGMSVAEGEDVIASGTWSHAEGYQTQALGSASHAEGFQTSADNPYHNGAHAEGVSTEAQGDGAHAEGHGSKAYGIGAHAEGGSRALSIFAHSQNEGTIAKCLAQTALGSYNVEDTQPTTPIHPSGGSGYGHYAVIIGNGYVTYPPTTEAHRSNALTVDWNGDVCLALDTTAASGTTDGDLYAAIDALGWTSDVIV